MDAYRLIRGSQVSRNTWRLIGKTGIHNQKSNETQTKIKRIQPIFRPRYSYCEYRKWLSAIDWPVNPDYLSRTMLIQEEKLKHWIDKFYGYGSWHARFWFISHEDGGGDLPEEVADKLNYFHREHPAEDPTLCDIRQAYRHFPIRWEGPKARTFNDLYEYRFDKHASLNGVWKNLIAFAHGYKNEVLPDPLTYQREIFASPSANNEALIRLYPLPSPHNHAWYYSWLDLPGFGFLKSRTLYQNHVYQQRIHTILSKISTHKPEVVLMYGMENINILKQSVQSFFHNVKFKMIKGVKQQVPQHHRADIEGTILLITTQIPALRHNRIETGFNWEEFGKRVR